MSIRRRTECFFVAAHGEQSRVNTLDYDARYRTHVIAVGTEGSLSHTMPYVAILLYLIHYHGSDFLMELENMIMHHGAVFFKEKSSVFEDEFNLLFSQYAKDIKSYPASKMRYYSIRDEIQDLELSADADEGFPFYHPIRVITDPSSQIGNKVKKGYSTDLPVWDIAPKGHFTSKDTKFRIMAVRDRSAVLANVPIGAYRVHPNGFFEKGLSIQAPVFLQDVLQRCVAGVPRQSRRLVLLFCCRGYGTGVPLIRYQRLQVRSLAEMMRGLSLKDPSPKKKKRPRQSSPSPKSPSSPKSPKRRRLSPLKIKTPSSPKLKRT